MTNWNWYGTWVIDWICEDDTSECFEIWRAAYIREHPELQSLGTLDLVMEHYESSLRPLENSLLMMIVRVLYFPINSIQKAWWKIRLAYYHRTH